MELGADETSKAVSGGFKFKSHNFFHEFEIFEVKSWVSLGDLWSLKGESSEM